MSIQEFNNRKNVIERLSNYTRAPAEGNAALFFLFLSSHHITSHHVSDSCEDVN